MSLIAWTRIAAVCLIGAALLAAAPARAQTPLDVGPRDPALTALQDRVDELEAALRKATSEKEELEYKLRKTQNDLNLANKELAQLRADTMVAAAPGDETIPAETPADAPLATQKAAPKSPGTLGELPASALPGGAGPAFQNAKNLLIQGDYAAAEKAFDAFLKAYGDDAAAPEARYWLGQTLLVQGAHAEAAQQFLEIAQKAPNSAKAPDAFVGLGVALKAMGQTKEACATLRDVARRYPKAPLATKERAAREAKAAACPA